jgi:hypothetical protein
MSFFPDRSVYIGSRPVFGANTVDFVLSWTAPGMVFVFLLLWCAIVLVTIYLNLRIISTCVMAVYRVCEARMRIPPAMDEDKNIVV